MQKRKLMILIIVLTVLISLFIYVNESLFLLSKNNGQTEQKNSETDDELLLMIKRVAENYYEEPEDAYIDRIWKKTPGRNGRKVNVEKSYEKMKQIGIFDESLLVYDQFKPAVSLHDLQYAPIYRGHPEKDMVALMINVSWGSEYIPSILETLKEHGVKATFFVEGKWAKENKRLLEMIAEEKHLIGNHAYNHPDMAKISLNESISQIERTNKIIEAIVGEKPKWFAPPSGSFNDSVVKVADDLSMETILWTVDTIDWKNPSVSVMINRVMTNIHPGATVLMHPTEPVVQGLATMITDIKEAGYRLGTVEQLLSEER